MIFLTVCDRPCNNRSYIANEKGLIPNGIKPLRCFYRILGWLMGLEPTTTGITILTKYYSLLLISADRINTNQQLMEKLPHKCGPKC